MPLPTAYHQNLRSAANLVDTKLRLFIFGHVPMLVKLRTIFAPAMGTSQEAVMAPAVADSSKLGYAKLYCLMLDHVSPQSVGMRTQHAMNMRSE